MFLVEVSEPDIFHRASGIVNLESGIPNRRRYVLEPVSRSQCMHLLRIRMASLFFFKGLSANFFAEFAIKQHDFAAEKKKSGTSDSLESQTMINILHRPRRWRVAAHRTCPQEAA